jgi:hypothetical protein
MFEHRKKKLLPPKQFFLRILRYSFYACLLLTLSLLIGMLGYRYIGEMPWIDAFLNASMILTGMGPINEMNTESAKIFAGCYAIYSGVAFLSTVAVLFAPLVHRFMHILHLDMEDNDKNPVS